MDSDRERPVTRHRATTVWFERAILLVAFVSALLVCGAYKYYRVDYMFADTAMYFQALENVAQRGLPVSEVSASTDTAYEFFAMPTATILKNPAAYFGGPAAPHERNLFDGHIYLVLYPLGWVSRIVPPRLLLEAIFAIVFVGTIAIAVMALRLAGVPLFPALLFGLLLLVHPAWYQSLLYGQFYPDRIFVLSGLAFALFATRRDNERFAGLSIPMWLSLSGLCCAIVNERGSLIAGIFLVAWTILTWKQPGRNNVVRLCSGAALAAFGYLAVHIFLPKNEAYPQYMATSIGGILAVLSIPGVLGAIGTFLLVNGPLFVIALFEWRAALIALLVMLPNIFGNIGGAEKLGWSSHYHSYYFPILIWAALLGYIRLTRLSKTIARGAIPPLASCALIAFMCLLSPTNSIGEAFSLNNYKQNPFQTLYSEFSYILSATNRHALNAAVAGIQSAIPIGSYVSSVEGGTPLLYHGRTIQFYPDGIDKADYAVLNAHYIDGVLNYYGAVSYLPQPETDRINAAAVERMRRDGYDLDHPQIFPADRSLAVVRRVQPR